MRIIKCGLREVALNDASMAFFNQTVHRVHEVKIAAHLLCKAWMLERFHRQEALPAGPGAVISLFQDAVCAIRGQDSQLQALCRTTFPPGFVLDVSCLKNWPVQAGTRYATQVAEHLSRCYPVCLKKYLGLALGLQGKEHRAELNGLVWGVMRKNAIPSVPPEELALLVPTRSLEKGYAKYDVKVKKTVLDYLPCMLHMASYLEAAGQRSFAVLPLVSSQVPGAVFIDTDTLLHLATKEMLEPGHTKKSYEEEWRTPNPNKKRGRASRASFNEDEWMLKNERLYYGQARLWACFLDLSKLPIRGPSLCFDNRIQTDGVSITVYAQHDREIRCKDKTEYASYPDELYVHGEKVQNERALYRGRTIVSIDPGKQNIIFAVNTATVQHNAGSLQASTLRYTARQRNFETKRAEARARAKALRATAPSLHGRTLEQWETWLSEQPSRRTLDPVAFRAHVVAFYAYAAATNVFWADVFHRKERFAAYRKKQRSEARLVKAFQTKFGKPEDVVVAFGNGARNSLPHRAPGPSTAIRLLLQRSHYCVLDVHEPYTSKRCFACKRPDANNGPCRVEKGQRDAWGVRRCCRCGTTWDRDFNACLNIDRLAREHLAGLARPDYLCRGT